MNVTALMSGGSVQERHTYDAYGNATVLDADFSADADGVSDYDNPIRYGGYWRDRETGLHCVRMRYYHVRLGRWLQRDPMEYADSMSLYQYVGSQPLIGIDPMGTDGNLCCTGREVTVDTMKINVNKVWPHPLEYGRVIRGNCGCWELQDPIDVILSESTVRPAWQVCYKLKHGCPKDGDNVTATLILTRASPSICGGRDYTMPKAFIPPGDWGIYAHDWYARIKEWKDSDEFDCSSVFGDIVKGEIKKLYLEVEVIEYMKSGFTIGVGPITLWDLENSQSRVVARGRFSVEERCCCRNHCNDYPE